MTHPKITGIIPGSSEIEEKQTSTYILNSHSLSHTVSFPFEAQGISFRTQSRNYYVQKIKRVVLSFFPINLAQFIALQRTKETPATQNT